MRARLAFLDHEPSLAHAETLTKHEDNMANKRCSGARHLCKRAFDACLCGAPQDTGHRLAGQRLKEQGSGDWWNPILSSEKYYSAKDDTPTATERTESGRSESWDSALAELKRQLDPRQPPHGVGFEAARSNLQHRDAVGATVLHACILSFGARRTEDPRLSERAFHLSKWLIENYGPVQMGTNTEGDKLRGYNK